MDEVAKLANRDPLEFRRSLMSERPKHLGVLNAAAEKAGWGKPLPKGVFRGIAQFMGYGSYSAAVCRGFGQPERRGQGTPLRVRAGLRKRRQSGSDRSTDRGVGGLRHDHVAQ